MCFYYMRNLAEVDIYFEKFLKHVTYSMRQSGVTDIDKRHFGTIKNRSRSMLHAAGYDPKGPMWEMAWRTTSTIFNYLDNKTTLHRYSPYQIISGKQPTAVLGGLHMFGSKAAITVPSRTTKGDVTRSVTYMGPHVDSSAPGKIAGHFVYDPESPIKIKRVKHLRTLGEVPQKMADETIINISSEYEDRDTVLWSALDDESMTNVPAPAAPVNPWVSPPGDWIQPDQIVDPVVIEQVIAEHEPSTSFDSDTVTIDGPVGTGPSLTDVPNQVPGDWINIDAYQPDPKWKEGLSTEASVNSLIETETASMGAEVFAASVSDKIHYNKAAALADHPGYAQSDAKEMRAMQDHDVWDSVPITSLTSDERSDLCRAHMLRYPKYSGEFGSRVVSKLKSRLVFDGRSQSRAQSGVYTASNTPRSSTIMTHLALKPMCKDEAFLSCDISTAFLRADQRTAEGSRCIVRLPKDIATFKANEHGRLIEQVHVLTKSLYGQRQSSKAGRTSSYTGCVLIPTGLTWCDRPSTPACSTAVLAMSA